MRLCSDSIAPPLLLMLVIGCNTVDPSECWPNTSGGFGGSGTIPIGAGVGATSGDFLGPPRGPLDHDETPNPCVVKQSSGHDSPGGQGGNAGVTGPDSSAAAGGFQEALLQQELDDQSAGGLICSTPTDCVNKCVAEKKYCWAEHAGHPYKPDQIGDLFQCIDTVPKASAGGSYTCLYRFTNGDVCIFAYGSKLGPFTLPAPPPLCVYKTP
jgi:hypothetical protein